MGDLFKDTGKKTATFVEIFDEYSVPKSCENRQFWLILLVTSTVSSVSIVSYINVFIAAFWISPWFYTILCSAQWYIGRF